MGPLPCCLSTLVFLDNRTEDAPPPAVFPDIAVAVLLDVTPASGPNAVRGTAMGVPVFTVRYSGPLAAGPRVRVAVVEGLPSSLFDLVPREATERAGGLRDATQGGVYPTKVLDFPFVGPTGWSTMPSTPTPAGVDTEVERPAGLPVWLVPRAFPASFRSALLSCTPGTVAELLPMGDSPPAVTVDEATVRGAVTPEGFPRSKGILRGAFPAALL